MANIKLKDLLKEVATAGGIAVIFVLGIFFYGSYTGVVSA